MLELQRLRDDKESAIELLNVRGEDARERIDQILEVDAKRRSTQHTHDEQKAEMNRLSETIGNLFKSGKREEAEVIRAKTGELKESNHVLKTQLSELGEELTQLLYHVPNIPNPLVPPGKSDADNEIINEEGTIPQLHEGAVPHWELTEKYNLIDFELGVKVTGAGFPIYRGKGARLQRALINFFLDQATAIGYQEVMPPLLINEASGYGTG